jgi:hypothetical protein
MISKCANPECGSPFRYLREGRLFQFELGKSNKNSPAFRLVSPKKPPARVEHFWLCGECSVRMTLTADQAKGVIVIPLKPDARRAAAS